MEYNTNLTPPWYTLANEFLHTFANSPLVIVKPLKLISSSNEANKVFTIEIIAKEDDVSFALRQIIKPLFD